MKRVRRLLGDVGGSSIIEFGLTAPVYFLVAIGVIEAGLMLWTQLGLQHGVEAGARCASVNSTLCSGTTAIQTYAAQQSYGLNPPLSTFTVSLSASGCGSASQVSASYPFPVISMFTGITITAQSCFPR